MNMSPPTQQQQEFNNLESVYKTARKAMHEAYDIVAENENPVTVKTYNDAVIALNKIETKFFKALRERIET